MADDTTVNVNIGPRQYFRRNRPRGNTGANHPPATVAPFHICDASLALTWFHSTSGYDAWQMDQPVAPDAVPNTLTACIVSFFTPSPVVRWATANTSARAGISSAGDSEPDITQR